MKRWILPLSLLALGGLAGAQQVGTTLPSELDLEGFSQTKAESFEDLVGRAVLLEFFAYW